MGRATGNATGQGAQAMIKNVNSYPSMDRRIDCIRVSKSDRQIAKEHMRDADFVAGFICRAAEKFRSAEGLLSRLFVHLTL
jgi:hypothetical protein